MAVLLVTSEEYADGEPGAVALDAALAERGIDARWVCWDDPSVAWESADLVAVRSAWDYHRRAPAFLAWAARVPRLLNGAAVFAWNHDKAYLAGLGAESGLPAIPTRTVDSADELGAAAADWGALVVKPRVSASGEGLWVLDAGAPGTLPEAGGPWIAQPLVESVRTAGEYSLYVLGGAVSAQFHKLPAGGEIRVNEDHGGTVRRTPVDPGLAELAHRAVSWVEGRLGVRLDYARVDLLHHDGAWALSELELIEPGLYLDVDPGHAVPFAALVERLLGPAAAAPH